MKYTLLLLLFFFSAIGLKAQDFNKLLGAPSDSIIFHQNILMNMSVKGMHTELTSVKNISSGGFDLTYQNEYQYDNKYDYSWNDYYFDTDNRLACATITFSADGQFDQVNRMLKEQGYYKISDKVLYKRDEDIKVTIYNTNSGGTDQVIFMYSRKNYKTPEN